MNVQGISFTPSFEDAPSSFDLDCDPHHMYHAAREHKAKQERQATAARRLHAANNKKTAATPREPQRHESSGFYSSGRNKSRFGTGSTSFSLKSTAQHTTTTTSASSSPLGRDFFDDDISPYHDGYLYKKPDVVAVEHRGCCKSRLGGQRALGVQFEKGKGHNHDSFSCMPEMLSPVVNPYQEQTQQGAESGPPRKRRGDIGWSPEEELFHQSSERYSSPTRQRLQPNPANMTSIVLTNKIEAGPSDLTPALNMLRVALCYLRSVGAAPWMIDVRYYEDRAVVGVSPEAVSEFTSIDQGAEIRADQYLPTAYVEVYAQVSQHTTITNALANVASSTGSVVGHSMNGQEPPTIHRFQQLPQTTDKDLVLAFCRPQRSDDVCPVALPWEPTFLEQCTVQVFCGEQQSLAKLHLSETDRAYHEALMNAGASSATLVGDHAINNDADDRRSGHSGLSTPRTSVISDLGDWRKNVNSSSAPVSSTCATLAKKRRQRNQDVKHYQAFDISEKELLDRAHAAATKPTATPRTRTYSPRRGGRHSTRRMDRHSLPSPSDPQWVDWSNFAADLTSGLMQCSRRIWYMKKMTPSDPMFRDDGAPQDSDDRR